MKAHVSFAAFLVISFLAVSRGFAQSPGTYISTLDNERYTLRVEGEKELVIYTSSNKIAAVLHRKNPTDDYKGETTSDMVASTCPEHIGKIETVRSSEDRIRMRLEVPTKNIQNKTACKMLIGSSWKPFELVLQGSQAEAGHRTDVRDPETNTGLGADKVVFQPSAVASGANELTVSLVAENQGDDRFLTIGGRPYNYGWCHLEKNGPGIRLTVADGDDGITNKYEAASLMIGGRETGQAKFNTGDRIQVKIIFKGLKSSGGVLKANEIQRLDIGWAVGDQNADNCRIMTIRNVKIQPVQ